MSRIIADRVKETTTTTSTGTYALAGAVAGFRAFSAVCANNDTCYYCVEDGTDWEVGLGTWTTGNNLARTTIFASSNANAAVDWGAGTKNVFLTVTVPNVKGTNGCIVAPSGGDYTTLAAAVTAGETSIYVRNGTYTLAANITLSANTVITGESRDGVIFDLANTYGILANGDNIQISNMSFTKQGTTGALYNSSGAYTNSHIYQNLRFFITNAQSNNSKCISMSRHKHLQILDCIFDNRSSTVEAQIAIFDYDSGSSIDVLIRGCSFWANTTYGWTYGVYNNGPTHSYVRVVDNWFDGTQSSTGSGAFVWLNSASTYWTIKGNHISTSGNNMRGVVIGSTSVQIIIADNWGAFNTSFGIFVDVQANANYVTVTGNIVNCKEMVKIASTGKGYIVTGNTNVAAVTGGTIYTTDTSDGAIIKDNNIQSTSIGSITQEKDWIRMQNTSGGTITAGSVVIFKTGVAAGSDITTTTTAGDPLVCGMVVTAISNNQFGYVQRLGKTTVLKANGTTAIAIGDFLTCYTAAGIAAKATTGNTVFAIALEAYSTADSNGVLDAVLIPPRVI